MSSPLIRYLHEKLDGSETISSISGFLSRSPALSELFPEQLTPKNVKYAKLRAAFIEGKRPVENLGAEEKMALFETPEKNMEIRAIFSLQAKIDEELSKSKSVSRDVLSAVINYCKAIDEYNDKHPTEPLLIDYGFSYLRLVMHRDDVKGKIPDGEMANDFKYYFIKDEVIKLLKKTPQNTPLPLDEICKKYHQLVILKNGSYVVVPEPLSPYVPVESQDKLDFLNIIHLIPEIEIAKKAGNDVYKNDLLGCFQRFVDNLTDPKLQEAFQGIKETLEKENTTPAPKR